MTFTTFVPAHEIRRGDIFRGKEVTMVDHLHRAFDHGIRTIVYFSDGSLVTVERGWSYRVTRSRA
jgi:hypothetical protein